MNHLESESPRVSISFAVSGVTEGVASGDMMGNHLQCPGATAWYQAWKPDPSTSASETKDTRRWLVLVFSVAGGVLPHTLSKNQVGGDGGSELQKETNGPEPRGGGARL